MLNVRVYLQPRSTCVFPGRSVAYSTWMVLRAYVSTHSLLHLPKKTVGGLFSFNTVVGIPRVLACTSNGQEHA